MKVSPASPASPQPVEVTGPLESNGGIPVNVQDQTSQALDLWFAQPQGQTTLTADASPGDTTINVTSSVGMVVGQQVVIPSGTGNVYFGRILVIAVNVITLDTPIDKTYPAATSAVVFASTNLNVLGSLASPQIFQIGPVGTNIEVDIVRIMGNILDATAMDDGKFGGGSALTNGIVLRANNGDMTNIWNVKSNGEIALLAFDAQYADKAPAGLNGFRFRNTYGGQSKHGVVIRLGFSEKLELLVQDDLTGLDGFTMMAQGHVVTD